MAKGNFGQMLVDRLNQGLGMTKVVPAGTYHQDAFQKMSVNRDSGANIYILAFVKRILDKACFTVYQEAIAMDCLALLAYVVEPFIHADQNDVRELISRVEFSEAEAKDLMLINRLKSVAEESADLEKRESQIWDRMNARRQAVCRQAESFFREKTPNFLVNFQDHLTKLSSGDEYFYEQLHLVNCLVMALYLVQFDRRWIAVQVYKIFYEGKS